MMDQNTAQKIIQELLQSTPDERSPEENVLLQENGNSNQKIMQITSQIQGMEERIKTLRDDKLRLEGIAEYTMNKAVEHRYKTKYEPLEKEKAKAATKSGKPELVPTINPTQERVAEEAKAPVGD